MRAGQGIMDWYQGFKTAGAPLAKPSEGKMEAAGRALQTAATGAVIGAVTGTGSALFPDGLSPSALGVGALASLGLSVWQSHNAWGRVASNANAAFAALAAHEWMSAKVAQKAGTTTQVLTNKAKQIAAHGEKGEMAGDMGADPLIEWGSKRFAAAH